MKRVNLEVSYFLRKDYVVLIHSNYTKDFIGYVERNCLQQAIDITRNVHAPIINEIEDLMKADIFGMNNAVG